MFAKKGLSHTTPLFNNLLGACLFFILAVPFALSNGANFSEVPRIFLPTCVIAALLLVYYYVINLEKVSLSGTIQSSYPLFTIILSFIFLHENPSLLQKLAALIVLAGTVILAAGEDIVLSKRIRFGRWFWIALAGAVMAGTSDFFAKTILNHTNTYSYILTYAIAYMCVAVLSALIDKNGRKLPKLNQKIIPTFLGVSMMELGTITFYLAISLGLVSVVSPASSFYVGITAVLAWIFLKEKVNKLQVLGVILSAIGVIFLGIM